MSIKKALQNTDIIKKYSVLHYVALFLALTKPAALNVSSWFYLFAPVAQLDRATDF